MIKKLISFVIILSLSVLRVSALSADVLSAECAVVLSEETGEVLFQKNAYKQHSMASTTKIMTSLLAVESGKLQNEIKVTADMLRVEGTSMGLLDGDSVSLDELLHGMLLQSGNDAANVTAFYLGGDIENFAVLMNERAQQIGMTDTNFVTPSGLDSDGHYSTAYDMALLGIEAVNNPKFLSVCSKQKATLTYGNPPYRRTLYNHNKLLDYYDYALGIKTGFTKKSGRCLVSYAEKDGVGLVAVTLNAPNDWNDHKLMLDYGFETVNSVVVAPNIPTSISVVGGFADSVKVSAESYVFSSAKDVQFEQRVYMQKFVYAPVKSGDVVGRWDLYADGKLVSSLPITVSESV